MFDVAFAVGVETCWKTAGLSSVRVQEKTTRRTPQLIGCCDQETFPPATPAPDSRLILGAVFMKATTVPGVDNRLTMALTFLGLVTLSAFSANADARGCGMMKPPAYMGMPPAPMPYPMHSGMRHGGGYPSNEMTKPTIIDVAKKTGRFDTLLSAVEKAGLTALLQGEGPFTLFAPDEAAFADLPDGALQEVLADKAKLTALLKYHLVADRVSAADVLTNRTLETASGQELPTSDLSVIRADIRAGNGIIHIVDKVLLPSS